MERKEIVSAFTKVELDFRCSVWEKKGYYRQGSPNCEYVSFEEKEARVSRPVFMQLMIQDLFTATTEVTDEPKDT